MSRLSLAWALPLVSFALAMAMAVVFLVVSLVAVEIRSFSDSEREAERLASVVARDMHEGYLASVSDIVSAYAPAEVTVLTANDARAASSTGLITLPVVHTVPIMFEGEQIGRVETSRLVTSGLSIPGWGIGLLVIMAGGLAAVSGHFFAARVVRSVQQISTVADALRSGDAKAEDLTMDADFTELREMYVSMRRAVASVRREADELRAEAFTNP
ncbi:MAG: hypothetical protein AAFS03_12035, partial [Pseudomonadota bacterium]